MKWRATSRLRRKRWRWRRIESRTCLAAASIRAVLQPEGTLVFGLPTAGQILKTNVSPRFRAVLALLITGTDLSVIALIGIILLIGIVKKNAIMMIDFALAAERGEGKSSRDAIFQACLLRFRPILMTTMAALLGALPLALGTGTGSELRRPLGISIIGGLIVSQMLTLFTTPVVISISIGCGCPGNGCGRNRGWRSLM